MYHRTGLCTMSMDIFVMSLWHLKVFMTIDHGSAFLDFGHNLTLHSRCLVVLWSFVQRSSYSQSIGLHLNLIGEAALISFKEFPIPFKRSHHFALFDENSWKIQRKTFHGLPFKWSHRFAFSDVFRKIYCHGTFVLTCVLYREIDRKISKMLNNLSTSRLRQNSEMLFFYLKLLRQHFSKFPFSLLIFLQAGSHMKSFESRKISQEEREIFSAWFFI